MADILPFPAPRANRSDIVTMGQSTQIVRLAPAALPRIPRTPPAAPMDEPHFDPPGRLGQFVRLIADFEADRVEAGVDGLTAMLAGEVLEAGHA